MAGGIIGSVIGGIFTGGAGPAIGAGIGAAIPSIAEVAKTITDRLIPDPSKRAEAEAAIATALAQREAVIVAAIQQQNSEQNAINLAGAQSGSIFVTGWRSCAGWVCVSALAYQYLFAPVVTWIGALIGTALAFAFPAPPTLVMTDLWPVLLGLLGLGTLRTVDMANGTAPPTPGSAKASLPRR